MKYDYGSFSHFCEFVVLILSGATQNSIRVAQVSFKDTNHRYLNLLTLNSPCCLHELIRNEIIVILIASQWMLQIPGATSYIGCIGKDKFGEEMKKNAQAAGINVSYKLASVNFLLLLQVMIVQPYCTTSYHNVAIDATGPLL